MIAPWAKEEMAAVDLGDERLDARAVRVVSPLGHRPNLSIPAACAGRAEMGAAYRFFDNDKATFEKVLAPHRERVARQRVALLVQDTSEIDLTRPEQQVAGAGDLGGSRRGFVLHEMQACTPEGTPLGTVWAEIVNRTEGVSRASAAEQRERRKRLPLEEKGACVGSPGCGRRGRWPSKRRRRKASVSPIARRTPRECSPKRGASGRCIG